MSGTRKLADSTGTVYPRKARASNTDEARALADCVDILHGGLSFGSGSDGEKAGHFEGQILTFTITSATGLRVAHGLGRRPKGYLVIKRDGAGVLSDVETKWTAEQAYFLSSRLKTSYTIILF